MTDTTAPATAKPQRPLSPHLQIYKWQITMTMSILHRATGVALAVGAVLMVLWLAAAASGSVTYAAMQSCLGSPLGIIALMGWSWSLFYHLTNGIRHLLWDAGFGYDIPTVYNSGYIAIAVTTIATILVWIFGLTMMVK